MKGKAMNVMKRIGWPAGLVLGLLVTAGAAWAGGESASDLVVVADTRVISGNIMRYFANLYNTQTVLFAVWAAVLTAVFGCLLGIIMDFIMSRTGLDLRSRKIIEH
jgi:ABC-type Fe3+ transport system permease subunit